MRRVRLFIKPVAIDPAHRILERQHIISGQPLLCFPICQVQEVGLKRFVSRPVDVERHLTCQKVRD